MSSVVGVSFYDPWHQKELMLAEFNKVSRARTVAGQDKALEDQFFLENATAEAKERKARDALAMKVFVDAKKAVEDARQVAREAMVQAKIGEGYAQALVKEALKAEADLQTKVREEAKLHRDFLAQFSIEDFEEEEGEEDLEYWWNQMEHGNCL
jgi:hypothetical protein